MKNTASATLVIPIYNEEKYLDRFIKDLLNTAKSVREISSIIFVNDGSKDRTREILNRYGKNKLIKVINHSKNKGKGAALKTGLKEYLSNETDYLIFMDADSQHDPKDLSRFINEVKKNPIVFGYRELSKGVPFFRKLGNIIARFIFRSFFNIKRKDLLCGFMAFQKNIIPKIKWRSDDYGVETEISALVGKNKVKFKEILIKTIYLNKSKGVNIIDAFFIFTRIPFWYIRYGSQFYLFLLSYFSIVLIFILLAFKNPFSIKSLVPNLEPYPDTLYYASPAWNFIKGKGFGMFFNNYSVKMIVPPLYSVILIPFFYLFSDVRSFYFANILLMIASIYIFMMILKKIFNDNFFSFFLIIILSFFLITNQFIYFLPSFLMSENLALLLLVISIYLLINPITKAKSIISGFFGILFMLTKFSNLPLTLSFYFLYALKFIKNKKYFNGYIISLLTSSIIFSLYIYSSNILLNHKNLQTGTSFDLDYFKSNLLFYLNGLIGKQTRFLWINERFVNPIISTLSFIGILIGLTNQKYKKLTFQLLFFIILLLTFMSLFYAIDIRFVLVIIPVLLIFSGIALKELQQFIKTKISLILMIVIMLMYLFIPFFGNKISESSIITFKKQIGLNFKHSEVPWYYIASQEFNNFFSQTKNKNSYLGTFLPPYYLQFYSNNSYNYLPIVEDQDFFPEKNGLLKQMNIDNIVDYYKFLLKSNKKVFVSNIYSNNLEGWSKNFNNLKKYFNLKLEQKGCIETCNIYRLEMQ